MRAVRSAIWLFSAALLLGVAGASAPVFVSATGTGLLHEELRKYGDGLSALWVEASGPAPSADAVRSADAALHREIELIGLPPPERTVVARGITLVVDGQPRRANLVARDDLPEELPGAVRPGGGPLAVTSGDAAWLGLSDASSVTVAGLANDVEVVLGPVVHDFDYYDMPPFWQPVRGLVANSDDILNPRPLPALLADSEVAVDLLATLAHGAAAPPGVSVLGDGSAGDPATLVGTWQVPTGALPTLEDARRVTPRLRGLQGRLLDRTTPLGEAMAAVSVRTWNSGGPRTGGQLLPAVDTVEASLAVLSRPVNGLGIAGQVLALGLVAVAATQAFAGRLSRARLFAVRGVAAPALAGHAAAWAALPTLLGVALGWLLVTRVPAALGLVEGVGDDVGEALLRQAPLAALAAVVVVAFAVGVTAALRARERNSDGRLPPVVEVTSVALVAVAWWGRGPGGPVMQRGDGTADADVVALALPLLLVVAVAAIGARLLRLALAGATGLADRSDAAWQWRGGIYLAFRRLRQLGAVGTLLLFVTAAGVGLLVAGGTLVASSEATIREKAGITVGGDARLTVPRGALNNADAMATYGSLPVPTTLVRRIGDALLDDRREVDVLTVDPDGFAGVAHQPAGVAPDLGDLLGDLAPAPGDGQPVEVIAVGAGVRDGMVLHLPGLELPVRVAHRVAAFPGVTGERTALVLANGGVLDPDDVVMRARLLPITRTELWLGTGDGDVAALREHVAEAGLHDEMLWAEDFLAAPSVAPVRATFAFVRGQAVALAALGLAGLLVHHLGAARERALSAALVGRMGLRRRSLAVADAVELAVLVTGAGLLGTGAGLLAARLVVADYDPLPEVPLPMVMRMPIAALWPLLLVAVVAVATTVVLARRTARRADIAAMLREAA